MVPAWTPSGPWDPSGGDRSLPSNNRHSIPMEMEPLRSITSTGHTLRSLSTAIQCRGTLIVLGLPVTDNPRDACYSLQGTWTGTLAVQPLASISLHLHSPARQASKSVVPIVWPPRTTWDLGRQGVTIISQ